MCVCFNILICIPRKFCLTNKIYAALKHASEGFVIHSVSFNFNFKTFNMQIALRNYRKTQLVKYAWITLITSRKVLLDMVRLEKCTNLMKNMQLKKNARLLDIKM